LEHLHGAFGFLQGPVTLAPAHFATHSFEYFFAVFVTNWPVNLGALAWCFWLFAWSGRTCSGTLRHAFVRVFFAVFVTNWPVNLGALAWCFWLFAGSGRTCSGALRHAFVRVLLAAFVTNWPINLGALARVGMCVGGYVDGAFGFLHGPVALAPAHFATHSFEYCLPSLSQTGR